MGTVIYPALSSMVEASCGLGGWLRAEAAFSDGLRCSSHIWDVNLSTCESVSRMTVSLPRCHFYQYNIGEYMYMTMSSVRHRAVRRCPATKSPPRSLPRTYFDTESPAGGFISKQNLPRRLYSKTKSPEERECFIPRRNKLSTRGVFSYFK